MHEFEDNEVSSFVSKFINGTNQSVFLTGKAGTGKTTLLKQIVATTYKKTIIAAPTGIAAINAGGVTLHSLFHLPFGSFIPDNRISNGGDISFQLTTPGTLIRNLKMNSHKKALLREMELLIIDEVSMLRADLLDAIDYILRYVRRNNSAFGGLQILFIGDLWQLPPVVKNEEWSVLKNYYSNIFFFNASLFKHIDLIYLELEKIYRQTDREFIRLLNNFRLNKVTRSDIDVLNKQYKPQFNLLENEGYVYLTTHNYKADKINKQALEKLPGKTYCFEADVQGEFSEYAFPIDVKMDLKEGAQVMFIKNDYSGNQAYYNGKIGKIGSVSDESIRVIFSDGSPPAIVEQYIWENKKFALNPETKEIEEKIVGTFVHYPIKLAWAITIHKSQGLTFDKAMIDISQAFAAGQTYVALSRLTSLKGLVLAAPVQLTGPEIHQDLYEFAQSKASIETARRSYKLASRQYANKRVSEAFDFSTLVTVLREHIGTYDKDAVKSVKQKYLGWAQDQLKNTITLLDVSVKFQNQIKLLVASDNEDSLIQLKERVTAAKEYFVPLLNKIQEDIEKHIQLVRKEKGTKKYVKEIKELQAYFYAQTISIHKADALCGAILNNEELNKKSFQSIAGTVISSDQENDSKLQIKSKAKKEPKIKTSEITYGLYAGGKTIQQIAKERSLSVITIEKHISEYIRLGKIDLSEFVTAEKIARITEVAEELGVELLKPIKEKLGSDYSYAEINYVRSWLECKSSVKN